MVGRAQRPRNAARSERGAERSLAVQVVVQEGAESADDNTLDARNIDVRLSGRSLTAPAGVPSPWAVYRLADTAARSSPSLCARLRRRRPKRQNGRPRPRARLTRSILNGGRARTAVCVHAFGQLFGCALAPRDCAARRAPAVAPARARVICAVIFTSQERPGSRCRRACTSKQELRSRSSCCTAAPGAPCFTRSHLTPTPRRAPTVPCYLARSQLGSARGRCPTESAASDCDAP